VYVSTLMGSGYSTNNGDYSGLLNYALRFSSGDLSETVTVRTLEDTRVEESSETFGLVVQRSPSDSRDIYLARSSFTIRDDDSPTSPRLTATLAANDATAGEPDNDGEFTVTLSGAAPAGGVTLRYSVSGTATAGSDYAALSGTVTIAAGNTRAAILVDVRDDSVVESLETVTVALTGATGVNSGSVSVGASARDTVLILDNETPALRLFVNGDAGGNVIVLGSSLETRTNGGLGADHYVVLAGQTAPVTIADRSGANVLSLDAGVQISSARLTSGTLYVDLAGGSTDEIQVRAATAYRFKIGTRPDLNWRDFLRLVGSGFETTQMVMAPVSVPSMTADTLRVFANGNPYADTFSLGYDLDVRSNGGLGADEYRLTRFQTGDVEISDRSGTNMVRFESGVSVSHFQNLGGTFVFTLDNTAEIQVRAAFGNEYQVGDGEQMTAARFMAWAAERGNAFTVSALTDIAGDSAGNRLTGTAANERLLGFAGNDVLNGGGGADILDGGTDDDQLTGGTGADVFVYRFDSSEGGLPSAWDGVDGSDRILDYSPTQGDKIRFMDQNTGAGKIDTLAEFEAALDLSQNPNLATRQDPGSSAVGREFIEITFGDLDEPRGSVSGDHILSVYTSVSTSLYNAGTGQFNDVDAFIEALGGADALLFG